MSRLVTSVGVAAAWLLVGSAAALAAGADASLIAAVKAGDRAGVRTVVKSGTDRKRPRGGRDDRSPLGRSSRRHARSRRCCWAPAPTPMPRIDTA